MRRWQAAKRQQQRRMQPEVRQAHAAAERERRARCSAGDSESLPPGDESTDGQVDDDEARGHAAEFFLLLFVTARAVMTRCVLPVDVRHATAAMIVAKPSTRCVIANVSG